MAQLRPEDIVQFYKESEPDAKGNQLFKCEYCRQESKPDFIVDYIRMIRHLYEEHNKSEIMEDPKYESVKMSFNLSREYQYKTDSGICLESNCGVTVKSKFGRALPFKNHSITHHADDKKNFFAKAVGIVSGQKILNNYEIMDIENATCIFCQTSLPLKDLDLHPAKVLEDLSRHLIPHVDEAPEILDNEVPLLEEALIQIELDEEEKIHLEVKDKKKKKIFGLQSIDEEVVMEETLRTIEPEVSPEDLNTLLQQYNSKIIAIKHEEASITIKIRHMHTLMERDEKDNQRKILEKVLKNLREKRREAATQISHQAERSGQSIPNEDVPETPDSSEIRSAMTQSSSSVEYKPGQPSLSGGEDVPEASVSGEMQSTTTQSLLTGEPLSK
ncbi:PREDICTED: uncharacterized protein LOC108754926 [Trachymyrmex septentrionalis]|uniref:uncharacterized protein LOC108754926 n=1 Tax=Trachymyrmex septentrionalis TaxID=34720 RepID=UPI00084F4DED|nr:PREDICTED: uncharacterized protein LOC108754926 [Trachymyrmex septentrionalis]